MKKIIGFLLFLVFISSGNLVFCSQNYIVNGTTYTFPDEGDTDWGQNVTDWAGAVTTQLTSISTSGVLLQLKSTATAMTIGFNNVAASTASLTNTLSSVATSTGIFPIVALSTRSIIEGNTTSYININYSTQTKNSGLILNGDIVATRLYGDGSGLSNSYSALSSIQGLIITTNGVNTSDFIITADRVVIGPTSSYFVNVATTISINKTGPGGIDSGTKSSDTWNTLWMLTGTTVTVVASSGTPLSPTLPLGYSGYKKIGYIKISTGGAIIPYYKNGIYGAVSLFDRQTPFVIDSNGSFGADTIVDLTSIIPPNASKITFSAAMTVSPSDQDCRFYFRVPGPISITTNIENQYGFQAQSNTGYLTYSQAISLFMYGQRSLIYQTATDVTAFTLRLLNYWEGGL